MNAGAVYHVRIDRGMFRAAQLFNLTRARLEREVLERWRAREVFEIEGVRWNPTEARLQIIAGPVLSGSELAFNRGWSNAKRRGRDVTEELVGAGRGGTQVGGVGGKDVADAGGTVRRVALLGRAGAPELDAMAAALAALGLDVLRPPGGAGEELEATARRALELAVAVVIVGGDLDRDGIERAVAADPARVLAVASAANAGPGEGAALAPPVDQVAMRELVGRLQWAGCGLDASAVARAASAYAEVYSERGM